MADGRKRGHASLVRAGHGKGCSAEGIRRQLAREADFSRRGSTFPFLRLIHFHFLYFLQFFSRHLLQPFHGHRGKNCGVGALLQ